MAEVTKKEQYDLEKKQRETRKQKEERMKSMKKLVIPAIAITLVVGGLIFLWQKQVFRFEPAAQDNVVSAAGIHWHAQLSIKILGQEQKIPANIGLGISENPIHSHDSDGIIHMEFTGRVTESQLKLGNFFKLWGKLFSKDCIFDKCAGPDGSLKMLVNGKENFEFENYMMQDGDRIEIVFE